MFKNPVYIPPHAVEQFKARVCNGLSTKVIRKLIMYFLNAKSPIKYQKFNHVSQPIYEGEFDDVKFLIPVIRDVKKKRDVWDVVPTILLPGMDLNYRKIQKQEEEDRKEKKGFYLTAQDLARELNVDRGTIISRIEKGEVQALNRHRKGEPYRIPESEAKRFKKTFVRPYKKWRKRWTETEIYILLNNKDKTNKCLAEILGRNEKSIKIMKTRLRKKGYNV